MAKILLVASGKGGTGKTSICTYTSIALTNTNQKVLLIDIDCGFKSLDLTLNLSNKIVFNFLDVFSDMVTIENAIVKYNNNLHLLSAPLNSVSKSYTASDVSKMISTVYDVYDFIFIDCSSGYSYETEIFSKVCHGALIVTTPDVTSVRGAENIARKLEDLGLSNLYLIINRLRPKLILENKAKNIDDIIDETSLPLLGIIPEDENVISATNMGISIFDIKKQNASIAYKNIANRLIGKQVNIMNLK